MTSPCTSTAGRVCRRAFLTEYAFPAVFLLFSGPTHRATSSVVAPFATFGARTKVGEVYVTPHQCSSLGQTPQSKCRFCRCM